MQITKTPVLFSHCYKILNVSMDYPLVKSRVSVPRTFEVSLIKK